MFVWYQPPVSSTFLLEQTTNQQSASSAFLSEQISKSHQPNEQAPHLSGWMRPRLELFFSRLDPYR
jgi:hypothetical protein